MLILSFLLGKLYIVHISSVCLGKSWSMKEMQNLTPVKRAMKFENNTRLSANDKNKILG